MTDLCSTHHHPYSDQSHQRTRHPWYEQILPASHQGDHLSQPTALIPGISLVEHACDLSLVDRVLVAPLFLNTGCIWQVNFAACRAIYGVLSIEFFSNRLPQGLTIPATSSLTCSALFCTAFLLLQNPG